MNVKPYDKWRNSHQTCTGDVDITDAVMGRIAQKAGKPDILKRRWTAMMLEVVQTRVLMKGCSLACGVLMGLIRMFLQVYSVLFT